MDGAVIGEPAVDVAAPPPFVLLEGDARRKAIGRVTSKAYDTIMREVRRSGTESAEGKTAARSAFAEAKECYLVRERAALAFLGGGVAPDLE